MDKEFFLSAGIPLHFDTASPLPVPPWRPVSSSSSSTMEVQFYPELNSWEKSTDQFSQFESALSSMVSSPTAMTSVVGGDSSIIRELIGKLGNICNSRGEAVQPTQSQALYLSTASTMALTHNSSDTSCYNTPLNSPPPKFMNFPATMDHFVNGNLPSLGNSITGKPIVAEFSGDPGFAERAAKFSCFGTSKSFNGRTSQMGLKKTESLNRSNSLIQRVSSSPSLKIHGSQMGIHENKKILAVQDVGELEMMSSSGCDRKYSRLSNGGSSPGGGRAGFGNSQEESSVSEQIPSVETLDLKASSNDLNSRKRKVSCSRRNKAKELSSSTPTTRKIAEDENAKRCKQGEGNGNGNEVGAVKAEEDAKTNSSSPKPSSEPPKDYIHVRARRGQATDSHSLAERVRREKISERMKLLQDLVPSCNKVTGKAFMLDEIINYVQSLQRQVEFLSMKLASVDFKPDFNNMDSALQMDNVFHTSSALPHLTYHPLGSSATTFYGQQPQQSRALQSNNIPSGAVDPILDKTLCGDHKMQHLPPLDGFGDESVPQDDLQSIVQMGFGHNPNQDTAFQLLNFHHGTI